MDIFRLYNYDLIFIHRESCPFGPPIFEWLIYKLKKPIIFDFDDAVFLPNFNPVNSFYRFLKSQTKTKKIVRMSKKIIVSNGFLEEYARRFNSRVYVIPTPIDTEKFRPLCEKKRKDLIIGWIGSPTTFSYLSIIFEPIQKLSRKYEFIFKIIGAGTPVFIPGVKIENYEWNLKKEVENFQSIDIGVYPLPDTEWVKGKAAFKAIQYMAVGVPVVASPVGMTNEIIQDDVNGFFAKSNEEWVEKISRLIESLDLRKKIGFAGRRTVEEKFSVKENARKYLKILRS